MFTVKLSINTIEPWLESDTNKLHYLQLYLIFDINILFQYLYSFSLLCYIVLIFVSLFAFVQLLFYSFINICHKNLLCILLTKFKKKTIKLFEMIEEWISHILFFPFNNFIRIIQVCNKAKILVVLIYNMHI